MNYVQHTRAAHERLCTQAGATSYHVSLYWALFFQWNAARFFTALDLDRTATMQAAHIGSRHTYRATLRDLDAWSLLTYCPSQSRYEASRCFLSDLSVPDVAQPRPAPGPEVAPMNPRTEATSGPHETSASGPEVAQALRPDVAPISGSSRPEVAQDSLLDKTTTSKQVVVNSAVAAQKNRGEASPSDDGHLIGEESAHDSQPPPGAAPKKKVAPKKKGVHANAIRAAATAPPNESARRGPAPDLPFAQSEIAPLDAFRAAFAGTDYELADLTFYHELVASWRDKKTGEAPRRKDWVATAKRFMLNDARDNRLKLAPGVHHATAAAGHAGARPTGYRSRRYDS
ncbi:MAG: hypothetical protein H7Z21_14515 [Hymenobacter sp.]|nr:hypothetical protein [Hymenobacter sp.]